MGCHSRTVRSAPCGSTKPAGGNTALATCKELRSVFFLPDERAVLIGGAEIHIDAFDLAALKTEELRVAEILSAFGGAFVSHVSLIAFDEDPFEFMTLDPFGVAPAAHEIGRLVDLVVIGARETKIVSERAFDRLTVVRHVGGEDGTDDLRFLLGDVDLL